MLRVTVCFASRVHCLAFCYCTTSALFGLFSKDDRLLSTVGLKNDMDFKSMRFCISSLHVFNHQIVCSFLVLSSIIKQKLLETINCCGLCLI